MKLHTTIQVIIYFGSAFVYGTNSNRGRFATLEQGTTEPCVNSQNTYDGASLHVIVKNPVKNNNQDRQPAKVRSIRIKYRFNFPMIDNNDGLSSFIASESIRDIVTKYLYSNISIDPEYYDDFGEYIYEVAATTIYKHCCFKRIISASKHNITDTVLQAVDAALKAHKLEVIDLSGCWLDQIPIVVFEFFDTHFKTHTLNLSKKKKKKKIDLINLDGRYKTGLHHKTL